MIKENIKVVESYSKRNEYPILDNKYYLIRKLGCGATGTVKLGKSINHLNYVAVKILKEKGVNPKIREIHHKSEISTLSAVQHKNIVNIIDFGRGKLLKPDGKHKELDYIVLEICAYGELFDFVYYIKRGFDENIAAYIFSQILDGVEACHKANIAHRDLKTENLLLDSDWNVKIGDFGYATFFKLGEKLSSYLGTLSYAAPEILNRTPYNPIPADIFSIGVILFILVTGKFPFNKAMYNDPHYKFIINDDFDSFWNHVYKSTSINLSLSEEFKSLINFLLAYDPIIRPSINEIRNHPFLLNIATRDEYVSEFEKRNFVVRTIKEKELCAKKYAEETEREESSIRAEKAVKEKFAPLNFFLFQGQVPTQKSDIPKSKAFENFYEKNYKGKNLKVREYSDNFLNPYKFRINCESLVCVLNFITDFFKDHKIIFNNNSSKFLVKVSCDIKNKQTQDDKCEDTKFELEEEDSNSLITNGGETENLIPLTFEIEVKKLNDICNFWVVEFFRIEGNKKLFSEIFEKLMNTSELKNKTH
jgi:serine/threonine protein kinase